MFLTKFDNSNKSTQLSNAVYNTSTAVQHLWSLPDQSFAGLVAVTAVFWPFVTTVLTWAWLHVMIGSHARCLLLWRQFHSDLTRITRSDSVGTTVAFPKA